MNPLRQPDGREFCERCGRLKTGFDPTLCKLCAGTQRDDYPIFPCHEPNPSEPNILCTLPMGHEPETHGWDYEKGEKAVTTKAAVLAELREKLPALADRIDALESDT